MQHSNINKKASLERKQKQGLQVIFNKRDQVVRRYNSNAQEIIFPFRGNAKGGGQERKQGVYLSRMSSVIRALRMRSLLSATQVPSM